MLEETVARTLAEGLANDLTEAFHTHRKQQQSPDIDQLREYVVVDSGEYFSIQYRNGFNSGLPTTHCKMNKQTGELLYNA